MQNGASKYALQIMQNYANANAKRHGNDVPVMQGFCPIVQFCLLSMVHQYNCHPPPQLASFRPFHLVPHHCHYHQTQECHHDLMVAG